MSADSTIEIPRKFKFLFEPHPYKIAYGGRSGCKSWAFARALLIEGAKKRLRILCAREIQISIKDSVHKLLSDQIKLLKLGGFYSVLQNTIRGKNGTEIFFTGLQQHTVMSIKSAESVDRVWVEEAQTVSKRSWDILLPTIRKEGSEIWVSFNPDLETDPTYQLFVVNPPDDAVIVHTTYRDNPWHNKLQEDKRLYCKKFDPDNYDNIWEGKCLPAVQGAIYFKQVREIEAQNRIKHVPYDPFLKVQIVMDLGWEDSLGIGLAQKAQSEIRIIEYLEAHQTKLDVISNELRTRGYNWGRMFLPHDGFASRLESGGKSTADTFTALGWDVVPKAEIVQMSVEEGIRATRMKMHQLYFDIELTAAKISPAESNVAGFHHTPLSNRLIEVLKRYRRHVNRQTDAPGTPVHDQFAHGADMLRYLCINSDNFINEIHAEKFDWTPPRISAYSF